MRKIKLDKRGLSPLVAVIVLLTLVMVLGAIIAGTLSGAPRPVLPATTAVSLATEYGGNPAAGDIILVIRHEYGQPIADAVVLDSVGTGGLGLALASFPEWFHWGTMELKINGELPTTVFLLYLTSNGEVIVDLVDSDWNLLHPKEGVWPTEDVTVDFAKGDMMVIMPSNPFSPSPLQSSDLIQVVWEPRDLMLVEYLVQ